MKTLSIILLSVGLSLGASAQHRGYYPAYRPHIYVAPSFGYGYGYPLGYPYYGYPYGYNPYGYNRVPYKLSLEIQSIKNDYRNQIRSVRKDRSIGHRARRQEIRNLKSERDRQIISAEQNYRQKRMNRYQNNYQQNNS